MQTPEQIREIAWKRIRVARILVECGESDDAFYMAGYAVELMLKSKICQKFDVPNIYDESDPTLSSIDGVGHVRRAIKIHDISSLLIFCGLRNKFLRKWCSCGREQEVLKLFLHTWSENCRYLPNGHTERQDVVDLIEFLSREEGVLQWIDEQ